MSKDNRLSYHKEVDDGKIPKEFSYSGPILHKSSRPSVNKQVEVEDVDTYCEVDNIITLKKQLSAAKDKILLMEKRIEEQDSIILNLKNKLTSRNSSGIENKNLNKVDDVLHKSDIELIVKELVDGVVNSNKEQNVDYDIPCIDDRKVFIDLSDDNVSYKSHINIESTETSRDLKSDIDKLRNLRGIKNK